MSSPKLLVATGTAVFRVDPDTGRMEMAEGLEGRHPTCLAADPSNPDQAWCGTRRTGVYSTQDGGRRWHPAGLAEEHVTALATEPAADGALWAGTEPSSVWRRAAGEGSRWEPTATLDTLPSSGEWAFPPRPETHHVRWIACRPGRPGRLWVAIEAGALVQTEDGGRTWRDRVPGGPYDTHELAIHPYRPDTLRVAAGDGYFESSDGGESWTTPRDGLEVGYLRSVAVDPGDPELVVVSASSRPRSAYVAGHSDGRLYRRSGRGPWERIRVGWPEPPDTIAPLLAPGHAPGTLWAADERGVHHSEDGGRGWRLAAPFTSAPSNLRGLVLLSKEGA
jgi:photosystem II stability/assembly factor-like uncharacterized protein